MDTIQVRTQLCDIFWFRENPRIHKDSDPLTRAMCRATGHKWTVSRAGAYCKELDRRIEWPVQVSDWYDKFFAGEDVSAIKFDIQL